jgi:threonylcarbamoyladenosine tRNA methylthiotransferase MtaB
MKVAFATLGCKVNQYETSLMCEDLKEKHELIPFDKDADIYIINTCAVTLKADYQSRQLIRRAIKRNKNAKVVAIGCYAERETDELKATGVHALLGNRAKNHISEILDNLIMNSNRHILLPENRDIRCKATFNTGRTRAFLKIQDGCNYSCSYCIVPKVRGKSRSAAPSIVYQEVKALIDKGYKEVVLSGIQLGSYGKDLEPNPPSPPFTKGGKGGIVELLKDLLKINGLFRLRLSSIEPHDITPDLINLMKSDSRICRHLHIPLQSGNDEILKAMGRNYTSSYYKELIMTLTSKIPDIGIGTDIIVGFPIETEHHFLHTYKFLSELPLSYFHVFNFSSRPGTLASDMENKISNAIKEERNRLIRSLGEEKKISFVKKQIGKQFNILVENRTDLYGHYNGLTDNYFRFKIKNLGHLIGEIIKVKVIGFEGPFLIGEEIK